MSSITKRDTITVQELIKKITNQVLERNPDANDIVVIGIRTRGVYIAQRMVIEIESLKGIKPPLGTLDITLYRDDFAHKSEWPEVKKTEIPFSVKGKTVVLVDDVLYTGRTTRAAIEAIMDFGRPSSIQLAVLVDRGHRELPIQPDYAGHTISTKESDKVQVHLKETDDKDEVLVIQS